MDRLTNRLTNGRTFAILESLSQLKKSILQKNYLDAKALLLSKGFKVLILKSDF